VKATFKDIVRLTYGDKIGMGCLQIIEIEVKHLPDSYIYGLGGQVWSGRNPLGKYLKSSCEGNFQGYSKI
jgi:hypothetical protein